MILIQKFGGTSVGSVERIRQVAAKVLQEKRAGHQVVVVVSAMAGETNRLVALAREMESQPIPRFEDLLVATGEQVSVALLSMALAHEGEKIEPFLGFQVRIVTDSHHGRARIQHIDVGPLHRSLQGGCIPIVAGFQGVTEEGAITTIGRGGGDITAVALAAALEATRCDIYTDVAGVYTADPRLVADARLLSRISYEEMLELADSGAKVLHTRAVEIAARYGVPLVVRSTFDGSQGTQLVSEDKAMEQVLVSGITLATHEAKVAIRQVPDEVGIPAKIFYPLALANINIDMILQNVAQDGTTDVTFTVPKEDLKRAMELATVVAEEVHAGKVEAAGDIAKVSVVGVGMRSHAGVAHTMFDALAREGIAIQMISTSEIKVSIVIDQKYAELAVRVLHDAFGLGKK